MQYNIHINQKALVELSKDLDVIDASILDYLINFCGVDDKRVKQITFEENGKNYRYTWINIPHLMKEMPLMRIKSKSAISRRIEKVKKTGFIKTFLAGDNTLYVRIAEKTNLLFYSNSQDDSLNVDNTSSGVVEQQHNHYTSNDYTSNSASSDADNKGVEINRLIELFKPINPNHYRLFGNKTERKSIESMIKAHGIEKIEALIRFLPQIISQPYAPKVTTPYMLEKKLGELMAFYKQEQARSNNNKITVAF